jgi:predicted dehydrogenase
MKSFRIGIIGCGHISSIYIENLKSFAHADVISLADLDHFRALEKAKKYNIATVNTPEELLLRDDIDLILNLTTPDVHAAVSEQIIRHQKHVYVEKPITVSLEDAIKILTLAKQNNVKIGCAPDTFLGGAIQTCRKIIEEGVIGTPIGANAFMLCHGHESWHTNPYFYYKHGGGPLFDMGPYYLTTLISLFGNVKEVCAMTKTTFSKRTITSEPLNGEEIEVETPTHITSTLLFENEAVATFTTSFDVWHTTLPSIEVYGTKGSLVIPDPNGYDGKILVKLETSTSWEQVPIEFGFTQNSRGIGVMDMIQSIKEEREHRANGELAFHVLEVMHGILTSGETKQFIPIHSQCSKPGILWESHKLENKEKKI